MSVYRSDDSITDENLVHTDLPDEFNQAPEETSPADNDRLLLESAGNNGYKRFLRLATLKSWVTGAISVTWGSITGNLADQTDLKNALDQKVENVVNADTGFELVNAKTGVTVPVKTLLAGTGITITDNGTQLTLESTGGGGGVTDHGALTGLGDDDHQQYFNQARGDARYSLLTHNHDGTYEPVISPKGTAFNKDFGTTAGTVAEGNHSHSGVYSPVGHTHQIADVTNLQTELDSKLVEIIDGGVTGVGLSMTKQGTNGRVKNLVAGSNVTLTDNGDSVTIAAAGGSGGGTSPRYIAMRLGADSNHQAGNTLIDSGARTVSNGLTNTAGLCEVVLPQENATWRISATVLVNTQNINLSIRTGSTTSPVLEEARSGPASSANQLSISFSAIFETNSNMAQNDRTVKLTMDAGSYGWSGSDPRNGTFEIVEIV